MNASLAKLFSYRMALSTWVSGALTPAFGKVEVCKSGPMAASMKATGKRTKQIFTVDYCIRTATFTRGIG